MYTASEIFRGESLSGAVDFVPVADMTGYSVELKAKLYPTSIDNYFSLTFLELSTDKSEIIVRVPRVETLKLPAGYVWFVARVYDSSGSLSREIHQRIKVKEKG